MSKNILQFCPKSACKKHYNVFKNDKCIYIWDCDALILCRINPNVSLAMASVRWYYKGVRVWQDMLPKDSIQAKCIGDFEIDIMASDVRDCLTVDRNQFASEFDYAALLRRFIKAYFYTINDVHDLLIKEGIDTSLGVPAFKEAYYRLILANKYVENKRMRGEISKYVHIDKQISTTFADLYVQEAEIIGDDEIVTRAQILPTICKELWENQTMHFTAKSSIQNVEVKKRFVAVLKSEDIHSVIVDTELSYLMENFTDSIDVNEFSKGCFLLTYFGNQPKQGDDKEDILDGIFRETGQRGVFYCSSYMPELFVSEIPMELEEAASRNFKHEGRYRIISPLSPMDNEAILLRVTQGKEDPEEAFLKHVMEREEFTRLIDWVYRHQLVLNKYEKKDIEKKYSEWLRDIYKKLVSND